MEVILVEGEDSEEREGCADAKSELNGDEDGVEAGVSFDGGGRLVEELVRNIRGGGVLFSIV